MLRQCSVQYFVEIHDGDAIVAACVADIAFVIDNSGSIRDNNVPGSDNWQIMIDFVKSIIELYTISSDVTRIAVVDFGQY